MEAGILEDKRCGECKALNRSCPSETVTWEAEAVVSDLESTGSYSREEAGENLARLNARVRELEAENAGLVVLVNDAVQDEEHAHARIMRQKGTIEGMEQKLKVMREDRDEFQQKLENCRASNQSVLADNRRMRQELLELHHLEQRRLMGLPKKNPWATLEAGDVDHESFSGGGK